MSKKLYDGGLIILIGFVLIAIGFGTLSVGINKANHKAKKDQKKTEKADEAKLIAILEKKSAEKKPTMIYQVPVPAKEVPVEIDEWDNIPVEEPKKPLPPEPEKPVEPEKPWYILW